MPVRRNNNKRSSERDVALVQMQIAAQARNQRWHDFLCQKRDDLQVRLRQQGYSQHSYRENHLHGSAESGVGATIQRGSEPAETSTRWGASRSEEAVEQRAPDLLTENIAGIGDYRDELNAPEAYEGQQVNRGDIHTPVPGDRNSETDAWWEDKNGDPL